MHASGQAGPEPCWSVLADGALHWESWGEQHAVFDSLSGETHFLPEPTAQVLRALEQGARTARGLADVLYGETGQPCDEELVTGITRLLQQLQTAGLVERSVP